MFVCFLFFYLSFLSFFSGSAVRLVGSWFPKQGLGLGLWGGNATSRILDQQRIPGPREY